MLLLDDEYLFVVVCLEIRVDTFCAESFCT